MKSHRDTKFNASSKEIASIIARYRASGLGLKAFALEEGLAPGRLHYWVYQRTSRASGRREKPEPRPVSAVFQEVELPSRFEWGCGWAVEVGLPGGIAVRFSPSAPDGWIRAVVQALQAPC